VAPHQVIDFLHWAAGYHTRLHDFYAEKEREAERPEVQALLRYMARHQEILGHIIEAYEKGSSRDVLQTWYKVSPDPKAFETVDASLFRPDMTVEEVIDLALDLDKRLLDLYRMLVPDAESDRLREAIGNLLADEEQEEIRLLRASLMD